MAYKAGSFYFPTSGGNFSVNIGMEPQGIIFFGGNQSSEEILLTPTNPAIFFGMSWMDATTGLIDSQALSNVAFGNSFKPVPINCCGASGSSTEYRASMVSFDSNGFTINVTTPAPGSRLIHYLAWGEFDGAEGASVTSDQINDFTLDYKPRTGIMFSNWTVDATRDWTHDSSVYFTMGVGNWPDTIEAPPYGYQGNGMAEMMRVFTQLGAVGYTQQFVNFSSPSNTPPITLGVQPFVAGSINGVPDHAYPYPTLDSEGIRIAHNGFPMRSSIAWWTGEGSVEGASDPNLGVQSIHTSNPNLDDIKAALFFGTTGYGSEQILGPNAAYMYGVLTPEYQGCVGMDTGAGAAPATGTPTYFQSKELCYVTNIRSPGVRAASGVISGDQVILTGEIADSTSVGMNSLIQMLGEDIDLPQFFRRIQ